MAGSIRLGKKAAGEGFSLPEKPRNRHGFDYSAYLASRSIVGTVHIEQMVGMEAADSGFSLAKVRAEVISSVQRIFPERSAAYINALLFGLKTMTFKKYVKCIVRVAYCISLRSQECMSSYFSNGFADASADWGLRKEMLLPMGVFS